VAATVLIADDDPAYVRLISLYLGSRGYRVITGLDGDAAYRQATACQPDIIVADIAMPGTDGYELCRRVRRDPATRAIPFIFLTGRHEETDKIKARKIGSDDFLMKPCPLEQLLERIEALLDRIEQAKAISLDRIGLAGRIEGLDVLDVIQTLELEQKTGALVLSHGERTATLYFREGLIVDADIRSPRREEPVFVVLGWKSGQLLFLPDVVPERMPITASLANLLLHELRLLEQHEQELDSSAVADATMLSRVPPLTARVWAHIERLAHQFPTPRAPRPMPGVVRVLVVGIARSGQSELIQSLVQDLAPARWAAIGSQKQAGLSWTEVGRVRISPRSVLHLIAIRAEKRFHAVWEHVFPHSHAAVVLLDPSSKESVEHIRAFLQAKRHLAPDLPIHVLASSEPQAHDLPGLPHSNLSIGSLQDQALRLSILDRLLEQRLVAR
jgi:DNA-binding response OmpR family regulator